MSEQRQFEIQTVIFPKKHWTLASAKAWAKDHKFRTDKVDETDVSFRFRQREPGLFARLRTICINPGTDTPPGDDRCRVKAVGGPLKKSKEIETLMPQEQLKVRANLPVTVRRVDPETRTIDFLASDETVDRYGTVISAAGWNVVNYRKNPVFLFGHNYRDPAAVIGRAVKVEKDADKGELSLSVLFAEKEINPLAEMVFQMYAHEPPFLNAVSVGFIPLKHEEIAEDEQEKGKQSGPKRRARLRFLQQELLEVSAVIVPANPNALVKNEWEQLEDWLGDQNVDPVLAMTARTVLADEDERAALRQRMVCWLSENGLVVCAPQLDFAGITTENFAEWQGYSKVPCPTVGDFAERTAVGFSSHGNLPKYPEATSWDGAAAALRLRKWASKDGSGDKGQMDWSKYRQGFAWFDPDAADGFGGYKLPHHDITGGRLYHHWRGTVAAMTALLGGRGGVKIPDGERRAVYSHLAAEYRAYDKEPPEFKVLCSLDDKGQDWGSSQAELSVKDGVTWGRSVKPLSSHPPMETCPSCDPNLAVALEQAALGPEDEVPVETDEVPTEERAGAVLNARNRTALKQAQTLIQQVLDSAEKPPEDEEEGAHGDKKKKPKKKEEDYAAILLETEPDAEDPSLEKAIVDLSEQMDRALHLLEELYEELVVRAAEGELNKEEELDEEPAEESESLARLDAVLARVPGGLSNTDSNSKIAQALDAVSAGMARLERQLSARGWSG